MLPLDAIFVHLLLIHSDRSEAGERSPSLSIITQSHPPHTTLITMKGVTSARKEGEKKENHVHHDEESESPEQG